MIDTSKGKLPIRYSFNTLRKIGDELDMTMTEMFEFDLMGRKMSDVFRFVLEGFKEGARVEGIECAVKSLDDIGDLLDEDPSILQKAIGQFSEDMKVIGEEGKKK